MKKKIKPCGIDLHLKYCCNKCQNIIWLSLNETKIKNYIAVCDSCNNSFIPKNIYKVSIKFADAKKEKQKNDIVLDNETKNKCIDQLVRFGLTKDESGILVRESFEKLKTLDVKELVKESLKNLKVQK